MAIEMLNKVNWIYNLINKLIENNIHIDSRIHSFIKFLEKKN